MTIETRSTTPDEASIHERVRARYADAALNVLNGRGDQPHAADCCGGDAGSCCATATIEPGTARRLYGSLELADIPDAASLASLGCGNPVAVAELHAGETVLDLGSGGGIDVLLSARRVGPDGFAYGLDMTDEMLELARGNAAAAGAANIEFVKGTIETIPLADASVDVVISNCVINLAADKSAVFREVARVLRPGGRLAITDIVAEDQLTVDERTERGSYTGCIAGALSISEFSQGLRDVGFVDVSVTTTHSVADQMHSAIVRATKPALS